MALKEIISINKLYIIGLILAIGILLFTASVVYKQTKSLQLSSDRVSHTLDIQKEINTLFSNYSVMVTAELKQLLDERLSELDELALYKSLAEKSLTRLKILTQDNQHQQVNLSKLTALQFKLYNFIEETNAELGKEEKNSQILKSKISGIKNLSDEIRVLKNIMLMEEERLLSERKESYDSRIFLTPFAGFATVLFSLLIFVLAFQKINGDRQKIARTQAFLENILKSTNNVIVYYEPIRDEGGSITDFSIEYSNDIITQATGLKPADIVGLKMSQVYPMLMSNGVFEILVKCIETNSVQQIERAYTEFHGREQIFLSTATKLGDGATLTSIEKTLEVMAERELKKLNESLTIQNTILSDAEAMAKIGSYRWDLGNLKSTISDNYYRILDFEPNEVELNLEDYAQFIHPEDLAIYKAGAKNILEDKIVKDITYRIFTKKGKIKYLFSTGHLENNLVVGLVKDVTEEYKAERRLREKNQELKRSNEELESFNRVASHDLQEPLRKIQMFLSRISGSELENLSEQGRGYIEKVNSSANRMQTLIKYLLSYSRINRTKKDFVKTDLNDILEKVQEDLEDLIKETGVLVSVESLPTLKAIPFQMEQLFNNLLSNAIKYRKANVQGTIFIRSVKVPQSLITENFTKKKKNYYRIEVKDNGIGFNQSNAKKIFELFQRLHQKDEYSGTGIGLAICKKITENHNGHIFAESTPNEGSSFNIYLPA